MASRTTKADLEAEIARLRERVSEQSEKITELLRDAENEFLHSHTYKEMQNQIKAAEISAGFDKRAIERLQKENTALLEEINRLKTAPPSPPNQSYTRGRKSKITEKMRDDIRVRHNNGMSIRDIAEELNLTKSTVHRALH